VFLGWGDTPAMAAMAQAAKPGVDFAAIRARVRADGAASVAGSVIPGLRAIACPVFDLQGRLALVATALAHESFPPSEDGQIATSLRKACEQVTEALGGHWPQ